MSYRTLWEVPDGLWEKIERILPPEKQPAVEAEQVWRTDKW